MTVIDNLHIHGPTLAALLTSALTGEKACDGLLFGTIRKTVTTQAHDETDALMVEDNVCQILGSLCCCSTMSFYDAAGNINDTKLAQLIASQPHTSSPSDPPIVGWFSYRPSTPLQPSMRDVAITASLQQWLMQHQHASSSTAPPTTQANAPGHQQAVAQPPVVFAVITSGSEHGGATLSLQYMMYQLRLERTAVSRYTSSTGSSHQQPDAASSSSMVTNPLGSIQDRSSGPNPFAARPASSKNAGPLQPLDLQILNLGQISAHGIGVRLELPALTALLQHVPSAISSEAAAKLQQVATAAAGQHVQVLEHTYEGMLKELELLVAQCASRADGINALKAGNDKLLQQLQQQLSLSTMMDGRHSSQEAAAAAAGGGAVASCMTAS
eukprot:jgi/Chrzof1/11347/Cz05g33080.t1